MEHLPPPPATPLKTATPPANTSAPSKSRLKMRWRLGLLFSLWLLIALLFPLPRKASQPSMPSLDLHNVHQLYLRLQGARLLDFYRQFEVVLVLHYEGQRQISLDIEKHRDKLRIRGFVERNRQTGYQSSGDRLLFTILQEIPAWTQRSAYQLLDPQGHIIHKGRDREARLVGGILQAIAEPSTKVRYVTPRSRLLFLRQMRKQKQKRPMKDAP